MEEIVLAPPEAVPAPAPVSTSAPGDPLPNPLPRPSATLHLLPSDPRCGRAPRLYLAPENEAGLRRCGVCSISSMSRNNVVWDPDSGMLISGQGLLTETTPTPN